MANDKTEEATPKKKRESRRKGQVSKSSDLAAWGAILVGLYLLPAAVGRVGNVTAGAFVPTMKSMFVAFGPTATGLLKNGLTNDSAPLTGSMADTV